jgi:hypothetical protein
LNIPLSVIMLPHSDRPRVPCLFQIFLLEMDRRLPGCGAGNPTRISRANAAPGPPQQTAITGQIVCYLNRTYRVLPTDAGGPIDAPAEQENISGCLAS